MSPTRSALTTLAVGALAALSLGGCSQAGDAEVPATPTVATSDSATGTSSDQQTTTDDAVSPTQAGSALVTSADGAFEVSLPEEWSDASGEVNQDVEVAIKADAMADDFFTNVVVASEEPIDDLERAIEDAAAEIAGKDGEYELLDSVEVGGETAYGYTITRTVQGVAVAQTQRWIEHDDRLYVVTLSSAKGQATPAQATFEELLAGWVWTD